MGTINLATLPQLKAKLIELALMPTSINQFYPMVIYSMAARQLFGMRELPSWGNMTMQEAAHQLLMWIEEHEFKTPSALHGAEGSSDEGGTD